MSEARVAIAVASAVAANAAAAHVSVDSSCAFHGSIGFGDSIESDSVPKNPTSSLFNPQFRNWLTVSVDGRHAVRRTIQPARRK